MRSLPVLPAALAASLLAFSLGAAAQAAAPKASVGPTLSSVPDAPAGPAAAAAASAGASKTVPVESIVARVNDKIITSADLEKAEADLPAKLKDEIGADPTAAQLAEAQKGVLAGLINDQLVLQKASDLGMSAETETVLQLDQLRQQNHLATMEDLEKAVDAQGDSYQELQDTIKNSILERKVMDEDIAPRITPSTPAQIQKFYNDHKASFVSTDEIQLSEIYIDTKDKSPAENTRLKQLASEVQHRAAIGEDFGKLAQRYSNGQSASQGGDIGFQQKATMDPAIAKDLFKLGVDGVTPVEPVTGGLLILKVTAIHHAGQMSLEEATNQIQNMLYQQKMQPEMQSYLANLRSDAYITVKPGFVDTGASASTGVNIEQFHRVLPSDMPKPVDKDPSQKNGIVTGGGE